MSSSWMTLMTDVGSQEPELADIIETEGDNPPYDIDEFVGGDANWPLPLWQRISVMSAYSPDDVLQGFCVPLGLLRLSASAYGTESATANIAIEINIQKGFYKGVAAMDVRQ